MGFFDGIKKFFGITDAPDPSDGSPSAADVLAELRADQGKTDAEWETQSRRLATLVFSEADRQRIWKRGHRGSGATARLLSGIRIPTDTERAIMSRLLKELESAR